MEHLRVAVVPEGRDAGGAVVEEAEVHALADGEGAELVGAEGGAVHLVEGRGLEQGLVVGQVAEVARA